MKILIMMILIAIITFGCNSVYTDNIAGPNYKEIQGVYYSKDSVNKIVLCLSGHAYGYYFFLKLDSSTSTIIRRGTYEYQKPTGKDADYTIGPPGYGIISFDRFTKSGWHSYAFFEGENRHKKTLVVDSIFTFGQIPSDLGKNYGFRKLMYPYEAPQY